jgi:hypothetical protein
VTDSQLLDRDVAILIATAPIWVTTCVVLAVLGAWNDWHAAHHQEQKKQ